MGRGGALGRDSVTGRGSASMGGSQKAEGDQQGADMDGAGATGGDAGVGMGHHSHTRQWNTRAINGGGRSNGESM